MGTDPATSATNPDCRLHCVSNAYAAGPALFPRAGSPNPMLSGVALARRLAEHLSDTAPYVAEAGYDVLFDGVNTSHWRFAGRGDVAHIDAALVTEPGDGLGLRRGRRSGTDEQDSALSGGLRPVHHDAVQVRQHEPANDLRSWDARRCAIAIFWRSSPPRGAPTSGG